MYWTDWSPDHPRIEKAALDGTQRIILVNTSLGWPNGLSIDVVERKLYWGDAKTDKIEVSNLDGSDRRELVSDQLPHIFGFSLLGNYIYWTDWQRRSIERVDKITGVNREILIEQLHDVMGIKAINVNDIHGTSPCANDNGNCSHLCLNRPNNNYTCSCPIGLELTSDNKTCIVPEAFLLFTRKDSIRRISLESNHDDAIPISGVEEANAIDYDISDNRVYWTDTNKRTINRAFMNGSSVEVIVQIGLNYPEGMAVDWIARNLYWTDMGLNRIEVVRLDGSSRKVILHQNMDDPRAIALDPAEGYMYWTDWGTSGRIERAAMDGTYRKVLIGKLGRPNAITIDYLERRLYWIDVDARKLESSDLSGNNRVQVIGEDIYEPYGLTQYTDYIYWTDWNNKSIQRANKTNGGNRTTIQIMPDNVLDIQVYHTSRQSGWNPCALNNGGCAHLCLAVPASIQSKIYTNHCGCPTHYSLNSDNKTCSYPKTFMLFSQRSSINRFLIETLDSPEINFPIPNLKNIKGLDYDPVERFVYWIDGRTKTVKKSHVNGTKASIVVANPTDNIHPFAIAVNSYSRTLFWSCSQHNTINVTTLSGTPIGTVIGDEDDKPRYLAVHPTKGFLFWVNMIHPPLIERSNMDGQMRKILFSTELDSPVSLTVDVLDNFIYWGDAGLKTIERATIFGTDRKVLVSDPVLHPVSLTILGKHMFWIDNDQQIIEMADKDSGGDRQRVQRRIPNLVNLLGVNYIDPDRYSNHACFTKNGGCSHICLITENNKKRCSCPVDLVLSTDGTSCIDIPICPPDKFRCLTGVTCIPKKWLCDGRSDCSDRSDENNCEVCKPGQFRCHNGDCVEGILKCDGVPHCKDYSDEECCQKNEFLCPTSRECLSVTQVCDSKRDCIDGYDESHSTCDTLPKPRTAESNSRFIWSVSAFVTIFILIIFLAFAAKRWKICLKKENVIDAELRNEMLPSAMCNGTLSSMNVSNQRGGVAVSSFHSSSYSMSGLGPSRALSRSSVYDRNHVTGASSSSSNRTYRTELINPPPSPVTVCDRGFCYTGPPYRYYHQNNRSYINHPPPPTPCSTDVCDESEAYASSFYGSGMELSYDSDPFIPPPPTPGSPYLSDENHENLELMAPPPSPVPTSCLYTQLIFSNRKDIRLLDYDARRKNSSRILIKDLANVNFIDFYFENRTIFWADAGLEEIRSRQINDTKSNRSIVPIGAISPDGLAVDWLGKKLYWTDSKRNRIELCNLDGSFRKVLFWRDFDELRAIIVVPMDGWIFWTDWGKTPKIEKASMDGNQLTRKIIVQDENCISICWPNGLAVDYDKKRIYWTDAKIKTIESTDFNGKFRQRITKATVPHPYAISLLHDTLYWTDWTTKAIHSCSILNGCVKRTTFGGSFTPMGIQIYHKDRQPIVPTPCGKSNGGCSHLCLLSSVYPYYSCACPTGVKLKLDGKSCEDGPQKLLLLVKKTDLRRISLDTPDYTDVILEIDGLKHAIAVDYDPVDKKIYWTDGEAKVIRRAGLNGTGCEDLVSAEIQNPDGIAIDWIAHNMYWTDAGTDRIEVARLNGTSRKILITENLSAPRAIILDPPEGYMYWTDWNPDHPRIEKAALDGTQRIILISTSLGWPNGLSIDVVERKLYWGDAKTDKIEVSNLDGSNRRELVSDQLPQVFGLSLLGDYIYWTDWQRRSVERANKITGGCREILIEQLHDVMGIKAINVNEVYGTSPCANNNGNCSHLCLNRPGNNYICSCPISLELSSDNKTCIIPEAFLLFTRKDSIRRISLESNHVDTIPLSGVEEANAIDYDISDNRVYWTDINKRTINRAFMNGSSVEIIVQIGLNYPEGMAVDWIAGNLYWSDMGLNRIEVVRLDGSSRKVLLHQNMDDPRSIALDPAEGYMYWTDWGLSGRIERAAMDGTYRKILIGNLGRPNAITIDYLGRRLYWIDVDARKLESSNLLGNDRVQVIDEDIYEPYGLTQYADYIYWTDWDNKSIQRANKSNGGNRTTIQIMPENVLGIQVYHKSRQFGWNPCALNNGGCAHLCLGLPASAQSKTYINHCGCPTHYSLNSDNKTCSYPKAFMLFSQRNSINRFLIDTLDSPEIKFSIPNLKNVKGLDYDPVDQFVYWIDGRSKTVKKSHVNGTKVSIVVPNPIDDIQPFSIAVNPYTRTVFWSCSQHNTINITTLNGNLVGTVIGNVDNKPRFIALHPRKGFLFWVNMIHTHVIERSNMDGKMRKILFSTGLDSPVSLTVDILDSYIYWGDAVLKTIERATIFGTDRKLLVSEPILYPVSLTILGKHMFWIDNDQQIIEMADKDSGGNRQRVQRRILNLVNLLGVNYVDPRSYSSHPCFIKNGGCSHICLTTESNKKYCSCPVDLVLSTDGTSCIDIPICSPDKFRCLTGVACIPKEWVCNGRSDCSDSSDENNCEVCKTGQFRCHNGDCIERMLKCDGIPNCKDHSDEECCQMNKFQCLISRECLSLTQVCDSQRDCLDGHDESPASCGVSEKPHSAKPNSQFIWSVPAIVTAFILLIFCAFAAKKWKFFQKKETVRNEVRIEMQPSAICNGEFSSMNDINRQRGAAVSSFHSSFYEPISDLRPSRVQSRSSFYDHNNITGVSLDRMYNTQLINPPPSIAASSTDYEHGSYYNERPCRHYQCNDHSYINLAPPPTPCSTDICEESEIYASSLNGSGLDLSHGPNSFISPPTPGSSYLSEENLALIAPPPSPVLTTPKFDKKLIGQVQAFLELRWSHRIIQTHFKKKGIAISLSHVSRIKNSKLGSLQNNAKPKRSGRSSKLKKSDLPKLDKMTSKPDPPTQVSMAKALNVSQQVVSNQLKLKLTKKCHTKPKCHHLSERSVQIRRQRSWPLYKLLRKDRWRKFITTDEAWIYLSNTNAKSKVQYLSRGQNRRDLTPSTTVPHPKGVIIWMGISAHGVTKPRFVKPGAKINSEYYIQKILKPFLKDDYCRLYPNVDAVFHQDSVPSHASKVTQINCLFKFQCDDGECISESYVCDGEEDCKDGSDERVCHARVCDLESNFRCRSGQCILKSEVCDGRSDCGDSSDESNCTASTCQGFYCGHGVCLSLFQRCDRKVDCVDGTDEEDCTDIPWCTEKYYFRCGNECYPKYFVCDSDPDCSDGSDEKDCDSHPSEECTPRQFKCNNGSCISEFWVCDGEKDCSEGEDEDGCETKSCEEGEFRCKFGRCIPKDKTCDGSYECYDKTDEAVCPKSKCRGFYCGNKQCVHQEFRCDGVKDCMTGNDEENCETYQCNEETQFRCDGNKCLLKDFFLCNGRAECSDGSDEAKCDDVKKESADIDDIIEDAVIEELD
ncbi:low-density lipoprotein receptor-related protein 1B [Parasteatoda tepidariorum]|uniref:low-density lipoprotein receptor-related protein 1B n=1 Tax=Parasteatoda tepidariorum TaxID=114398 RepID=UPI0039BD828E